MQRRSIIYYMVLDKVNSLPHVVYCATNSSSCSVEGQAKDLNHFKVHSSSDVVRDIHHELLIYSANLRILETVGQGLILIAFMLC